MKKSEQLAEAHWQWLMEVLEVVYKGAFIHGYKHGVEEKVYLCPTCREEGGKGE